MTLENKEEVRDENVPTKEKESLDVLGNNVTFEKTNIRIVNIDLLN